jgi:hypothetical protein
MMMSEDEKKEREWAKRKKRKNYIIITISFP